MKYKSLTIINLVFACYSLSLNGQTSQSSGRKPASQQTSNSGGMSQNEKLIHQEQTKTVTQRTIEGFNKGMERTDASSTAAAAGTLLYNTVNKNTQSTTKTNSSSPKASKQ